MNARQTRFVQEYLIDPSATRAARKAGYSARTANVIGYENLTKPHIAAAIEQAQAERAQRTKVDADRVIEELALVAFGRMGDFYDRETGQLLEVHEMPEEVQARVSVIKITRERTHATTDGQTEISVHESLVELKTWDKVASLQLLGRHLGLFKDKLEHSGEVSLMDALRRIERREDEAKAAAKQRQPA